MWCHAMWKERMERWRDLRRNNFLHSIPLLSFTWISHHVLTFVFSVPSLPYFLPLHFTSLSSPFHLSVISISSLSSGMIESAVEAIKASLDDLPGLPRTYFGDFHTIYTILLIQFLTVMCSVDFPCFKCWRAAVQISNFYSLTNPNLSHLTSFVSVRVSVLFKGI